MRVNIQLDQASTSYLDTYKYRWFILRLYMHMLYLSYLFDILLHVVLNNSYYINSYWLIICAQMLVQMYLVKVTKNVIVEGFNISPTYFI